MSDVISRQALMKEFSDFVRASNNSDFARTPTWNDAVSLVGSMPSAQPEQKWISCSERLPREEEQDDELGVLVTLGNGYSGLQCDWYHGDHWYDWDGFVVAWMPLPPVYQEEDNK